MTNLNFNSITEKALELNREYTSVPQYSYTSIKENSTKQQTQFAHKNKLMRVPRNFKELDFYSLKFLNKNFKDCTVPQQKTILKSFSFITGNYTSHQTEKNSVVISSRYLEKFIGNIYRNTKNSILARNIFEMHFKRTLKGNSFIKLSSGYIHTKPQTEVLYIKSTNLNSLIKKYNENKDYKVFIKPIEKVKPIENTKINTSIDNNYHTLFFTKRELKKIKKQNETLYIKILENSIRVSKTEYRFEYTYQQYGRMNYFFNNLKRELRGIITKNMSSIDIESSLFSIIYLRVHKISKANYSDLKHYIDFKKITRKQFDGYLAEVLKVLKVDYNTNGFTKTLLNAMANGSNIHSFMKNEGLPYKKIMMILKHYEKKLKKDKLGFALSNDLGVLYPMEYIDFFKRVKKQLQYGALVLHKKTKNSKAQRFQSFMISESYHSVEAEISNVLIQKLGGFSVYDGVYTNTNSLDKILKAIQKAKQILNVNFSISISINAKNISTDILRFLTSHSIVSLVLHFSKSSFKKNNFQHRLVPF